MRALDLKHPGGKQRDIAVALAVTEAAVRQWLRAARDAGAAALRARPAAGAPPQLTAAQRQRLPEFLQHEAQAYGFRGAVWTCARGGRGIAAEDGVA